MSMRIDYSVPKISRSSSQTSQKRTRNVSFGCVVVIVIITALISLGIGFGSGLMFSRRSAQTPREQSATPPPHSVTAQKQAADASVPPNPTTATGGQQVGDAPLRFYTMLPRGQTNTTLGSGINSKDDKPATQSLPAAPAMSADAVGFTVLVASYSLKSAAETLHATQPQQPRDIMPE